mgnify:CR=1 FL=1
MQAGEEARARRDLEAAPGQLTTHLGVVEQAAATLTHILKDCALAGFQLFAQLALLLVLAAVMGLEVNRGDEDGAAPLRAAAFRFPDG